MPGPLRDARRRFEGAVDWERVEAVRRRRQELGSRFPAIALFLFDCADPERLRQVLARIPKPVDDWLAEIVVMLEPGAGLPPLDGEALRAGRAARLELHRSPRDYGHGGARKAAFEYALRQRFDQLIAMRGDGVHPPECLPSLIHAALEDGRRLVLVSRFDSRGSGMPRPRALARSLANGAYNRVLGLRLHDYQTTFRLYPTAALECIPFQLNANDVAFEMQCVIQFRALGAPIHELPVQPAWQETPSAWDGLARALRSGSTALGYRFHQLHLTRRGRYLVDHGVHYTLKRSETGSHMQIVHAIEPGRRVLDLGCSQGLLARPLREKGVRVTGVDAGPPRRLAAELEEYFQRDLEQPLELPTGRVFDYVVVADVIEHLRNRTQLLRSARRFLKEDGRLIISTGNIALWFYRLSLLAGRFEYGPRGILDWTHVHLYTRDTFRREVERAGFHVVRERVTALPFEVLFESTGRSRLVRGLARLYHALARLWPEMFAYQLILEAEITTLDEDATLLPTG